MGNILRFPEPRAAETVEQGEPELREERFLALADEIIAEVSCAEPPRQKRAAARPSHVTRTA